MKNFLIYLVIAIFAAIAYIVFGLPAQAQVLGTLEVAQGVTSFTDEACALKNYKAPVDGHRAFFTNDETKAVVEGCYFYVEGHPIPILFDDGSLVANETDEIKTNAQTTSE